ncbi:Protein polyglycylase TTLL10 [Hondaea fermentalgiana]|uniref:Protein polyglycylase TTLL10 n=1 Tax=Hondaea fermentalgiana TaxID=2315210 RepID=A0A2R5GN57_9STRA|nr:Protein polyglycylase TTLL10 [Hondaea fermentalgiana]|eukprot:GBG32320.1 Protein polyglycylase TTLL10 [Hondaea fermentalgiana]
MRPSLRSTLRLVMPQWQGGDLPTYALGARVLAALLPEAQGPVETVKVAAATGEKEDGDRPVQEGIKSRAALLSQLEAAKEAIARHEPEAIVTVGGDCLVDLAPIAYLHEKYGQDLAVLWVDAHPDIMSPQEFENAHAHVLAMLMGKGDEGFTRHVKMPLDPSQVLYVGVNNPSDFEKGFLTDKDLSVLSPSDLETSNQPVLDWLKARNAKHVAVHFDLDVLDPSTTSFLYFNRPEVPSSHFDGIARGQMKLPKVCSAASRKYSNVGFDYDPALAGEKALTWLEFRNRIRVHDVNKTLKTPRSLELSKHMPKPVGKSKRRSFGCLREGCRGLEIEDMIDRGWSMRFKSCMVNGTRDYKEMNYHLTFLLADTTNLNHMQQVRPDLFEKIIDKYEGSTYLTAFEGGDAIGGNKGQQLRTKIRFAHQHHCKYNELGIQPPQYRLYLEDECADLEDTDGRALGLTWLLKPEAGSQGQGITFHANVEDVRRKRPEFFPCREQRELPATKRALVQQYIERPLLLHECKFDVRVYMLVANAAPWFVFYHEGYLRRSLWPYSPMSKDRKVYLTNTHYQSMKPGFKLSDHVWPFASFQEYLSEKGITGAHYIDSILNPYIRSVAQYVFKSAQRKIKARRGSYQITGLDFMIDENFHVHFIEANGYPGFTWSINFDSRKMIETFIDLVVEMNEQPEPFRLMREGDRYADWQLVYSEIDEARRGLVYNPCEEFQDNYALSAPLRVANKLFAGISSAHKSASTAAFDDETRFVPRIPGWRYLGGDAGDTFATRAGFAKARCAQTSYSLLRVEPRAARMYNKAECESFFASAPSSTRAVLLKHVQDQGWDDRGASLVYFGSANEMREDPGLYPCTSEAPHVWLAQDHVADALLLDVGSLHRAEKIKLEFDETESTKERRASAAAKVQELELINPSNPLYEELPGREVTGKKLMSQYVLRAYMLVASVEPLMVFYHDGYLLSRRPAVFDGDRVGFRRGEHCITFGSFQYHLASEQLTGPQYVSSTLRPYLRKVMEFAFHSARPEIARLLSRQRAASNDDQEAEASEQHHHQLFAFDFVLGKSFRVHLESVRGDPEGAASWFPVETMRETSVEVHEVLTTLAQERRRLVLELAASPGAFARMRYGDKYGGFRLVFSEMEELRYNLKYDPCEWFGKDAQAFLGAAQLKRTADLQDFREKRRVSHKREMEKYVKKRWASCKLRSSKDAKESCIYGEIAYRYLVYVQKERIPYDPDFVTTRIHELMGLHGGPQLPQWKIEMAKKRASGA